MKKNLIASLLLIITLATTNTVLSMSNNEKNASDSYAYQEQLFTAIEDNDLNRVQKIVTCRPDIIHTPRMNEDRESLTPLHKASALGHQDIVLYFLNEKATIDILDENKRTPLHLAADNGHPSIVTCLLQHNANPNKKNSQHSTPLWLAMYTLCHAYNNCDNSTLNRYIETAKALLGYGANINIEIDWFISNQCHRPLLALFIAHGATSIVDAIEEFKPFMHITKTFDTQCKNKNIGAIREFLCPNKTELRAILAYRTNFIVNQEDWVTPSDGVEDYLIDTKNISKIFAELCKDKKIMAAMKKYARKYVFTKLSPKILQETKTQATLFSDLQRGAFAKSPQGQTNQSTEFVFKS